MLIYQYKSTCSIISLGNTIQYLGARILRSSKKLKENGRVGARNTI